MSEYLENRRLRKSGLAPELPTKKDKKPIAKKSAKRIKKEAEEKERLGGGDTMLVKWYKNQMKHMNVCEETGMKLETKIYRYAIMSICHLLPKAYCESVAVHPANRVFLLPDLHFKWDSQSWEEREKWAVWPVVRERLIMLWPDLAPNERKYFPESVRKFIESKEPF